MTIKSGQAAHAAFEVMPGDRERYAAELKGLNMGALWAVYRNVLTPEPRQREVPYLWPWSVVRPRLMRAGELITAAEAERRAVMLMNPGNPQGYGATATLYAAAQLILPGESARAHRHSAAALRFVIEGKGAFTCVEGEKIVMSPGDLVLTPAMIWHDHGNNTAEPMIWLDGLDLPLVGSLNCTFLEEFRSQTQPESLPRSHSERLFGRALFPSGVSAAHSGSASPVWSYRWDEARDALECLRQTDEPDRFNGYMLRYANPANGGETFPTMGCRLQLIPKGEYTAAHRHTYSAVYHVAEGSGFSILDGIRFDWRKGDTFAVPIWCWHEHAAPDQDAVLFAFTDQPVMDVLGLSRSEAYPGNDGRQPAKTIFRESE